MSKWGLIETEDGCPESNWPHGLLLQLAWKRPPQSQPSKVVSLLSLLLDFSCVLAHLSQCSIINRVTFLCPFLKFSLLQSRTCRVVLVFGVAGQGGVSLRKRGSTSQVNPFEVYHSIFVVCCSNHDCFHSQSPSAPGVEWRRSSCPVAPTAWDQSGFRIAWRSSRCLFDGM